MVPNRIISEKSLVNSKRYMCRYEVRILVPDGYFQSIPCICDMKHGEIDDRYMTLSFIKLDEREDASIRTSKSHVYSVR